MMSLKCVIFFLVMVWHAVNAFYPEGYIELARTSSKTNANSLKEVDESLKEALVEALADVIKSELLENMADDKSEQEGSQLTSESRLESSWTGRDRDKYSVSVDIKENDALQPGSSINSQKRDDYYEGLEKKSQRSNFMPPPRKTFYNAPDTIDSSAPEENVEIEDFNHKRFHRTVNDDHNNNNPEKEPSDIMEAESFPMMDALYLPSTLAMQQQQQTRIHTPPWRLTDGRMTQKMIIREQMIPIIPPPPIYLHEDPKPIETPDPQIPKAEAQKHRSSYRPRPQPQPRQPPPRYVPRKTFKGEARFKSVPKPKPIPYANEFKKNPIMPKFADLEDKSLFSPSGKPVRQQFHEQGTRGPHSYKFGYSTGDKENPMARYEERGADGIVRGSYSFVDARGDQQVVHYESHPKFGFKSSSSPLG